jgi:hypothetical protein
VRNLYCSLDLKIVEVIDGYLLATMTEQHVILGGTCLSSSPTLSQVAFLTPCPQPRRRCRTHGATVY